MALGPLGHLLRSAWDDVSPSLWSYYTKVQQQFSGKHCFSECLWDYCLCLLSKITIPILLLHQVFDLVSFTSLLFSTLSFGSAFRLPKEEFTDILVLCFSCNLFHIIYILSRWNLSWSQCIINIELRSMKYHLVCFPDFDKWHSNVLSDFGFDTLRQWTCYDFSGQQGFFFFSSQSFFCCHFVFPNNHPLCNTSLFTFFLGILYLPKAYLGRGTFQCFNREVAISFLFFRWWNWIPEGKLDHQKDINWTPSTWFPISCSFKHGALLSATVTFLCQIHWLTQLPWLHWQCCWAHMLSSGVHVKTGWVCLSFPGRKGHLFLPVERGHPG